ncbi:MAG: hypothetical protein SF029_19905 [bacterium]|nr:hypothetical protein [bacterium]
MKSVVARGKTYLISKHAWEAIRRIDIDLEDVVRILEAPRTTTRHKHKIEYTGCYMRRYAKQQGEGSALAVKIVVNTRSTLTVKTVHNMGVCEEEEGNGDEGNV